MLQATDPREFWNRRFADAAAFYGTAPNAWLVSQAGHLPEPMAEIASFGEGEGRNAVWLAGLGHDVTAIDASDRALEKAASLARDQGVSFRRELADLASWQATEPRFDAAIAIFLHMVPEYRARAHRAMLASLRPGGVLMIEAFSPYQHVHMTGGPRRLDMLYSAYMLQRDFAEAEILSLEECETVLSEGEGHIGPAAVVRMVARRV